MITSAKIYLTDCTDPHRNLAMEEAMLTSLPDGQAILFLWQNRHTVVIGSGQNAWRECNTSLLRQEGGTLARRSSGGGAVYHDLGNLNFSFIVPREDYDVDRQLSVVMAAVRAHGLEVEKSGRNDLTVDGRKFSGNAFRLLKDSALHHGTLLVASDMETVGRYLTPDSDKMKAKGVKSVASRVTNLSALADVTIESMAEAMMKAFQTEYGAAEPCTAAEEAFPTVRSLIDRYESWDWNYGASPVANTSIRKRFPWGSLEIAAQVEKGVIESASVFTDSMDETLADRLRTALIGVRWQGEALKARAASVVPEDAAEWLGEV